VKYRKSALSILGLCLWCCSSGHPSDGQTSLDLGARSDASSMSDHDQSMLAVDAGTLVDSAFNGDVLTIPDDMSVLPNIEIRLEMQVLEEDAIIAFGQIDQGDRQHAKQLRVTNLGSTALQLMVHSDHPMIIFDEAPFAEPIAPGESVALAIRLDTEDAHQEIAAILQISSVENDLFEQAYPVTGSIRAYVRDVAEPDLPYRDALEAIRADRGLVGLASAVVRGRDIITLEAAGFADREAQIPIDPRRSQFRWASVSKGLAAIVALRHADRLDLDTNIETYLPDYAVPSHFLPSRCGAQACAEPTPEENQFISLRMLLSHRAGIQHYSNGVTNPTPAREDINNPAINTGMAWALPLFTANPLVAIPDVRTEYSSFGFNLVGVILEEVLQWDYESLVLENIARRLGMNTFAADRAWVDVPNRVVGYTLRNGQAFRDGTDDVSWKLAAGGFISTIVDFARYCGGLMDDVLLPEAIRDGVLWSPVVEGGGVALGFFVRSVDNKRQVHHSGLQQNTATFLNLHADDGLCFVTMTNTVYGDPQGLGLRLEEAWLRTRPPSP
jgi:serine beta-lactamase-like protein LACTB